MYGFIYITENLVDGRKYVGQKKYNYGWETYFGSGVRLTRAINKYGLNNFKRTIIENCYSKTELNVREKYWISHYNAVYDDNFYNLTAGGDGGAAYGHAVSDETREKLRLARAGFKHTDEAKEKISIASKNRVRSEETRQKHRDAVLGKKHTEEAKKRMSAAQMGHYVSEETKAAKRIPINQMDLYGNFIKTWRCAKDVSIELGYSRGHICACLKGDRHSHAGYKWEYANIN